MESPKAYKGCLLRWKLKYQTTLKESSYPCGRGISSEITSEDYYDFIIVDDERVIIRTKLEKPSKIKGLALI